jgi:hypothetical protein
VIQHLVDWNSQGLVSFRRVCLGSDYNSFSPQEFDNFFVDYIGISHVLTQRTQLTPLPIASLICGLLYRTKSGRGRVRR